jgi:zinc transport system substrate-binding protein
MRYPVKLGILFFIFIFIWLPIESPAAGKIPVFVSIAPQKYFVQQIGKDLVDIQVMVPPGANPATYEPKPKQMVALTKTRIYFAIGVPFENVWLARIKAANPQMKVIHTDEGIEKRTMRVHPHHQEGRDLPAAGTPQKARSHVAPKGLDPHIWLAPPLVKIQAHTIAGALERIDPGHRGIYEANGHAFAARIDQLDTNLKKTLAGKQGFEFMVFHPSWGYFAEAYGLKQVPIEIEGKNPKPAQLQALIAHARARGVRVIFVQPQFATKSAKVVAREIGGQVVFADPLAEDWMANLNKVAEKFKAALK